MDFLFKNSIFAATFRLLFNKGIEETPMLTAITIATVAKMLVLALLLGLGIAGAFVPVLPGPPIAYVAMWWMQWMRMSQFSTTQLVVLGLLAATVTLLDNFLPVIATKQSGGSKASIWGCFIGMALGLVVPTFGIVVGALVGAVIGQFIASQQLSNALKVGFKTFMGIMLGTGIKLVYGVWIAILCIKQLILYLD